MSRARPSHSKGRAPYGQKKRDLTKDVTKYTKEAKALVPGRQEDPRRSWPLALLEPLPAERGVPAEMRPRTLRRLLRCAFLYSNRRGAKLGTLVGTQRRLFSFVRATWRLKFPDFNSYPHAEAAHPRKGNQYNTCNMPTQALPPPPLPTADVGFLVRLSPPESLHHGWTNLDGSTAGWPAAAIGNNRWLSAPHLLFPSIGAKNERHWVKFPLQDPCRHQELDQWPEAAQKGSHMKSARPIQGGDLFQSSISVISRGLGKVFSSLQIMHAEEDRRGASTGTTPVRLTKVNGRTRLPALIRGRPCSKLKPQNLPRELFLGRSRVKSRLSRPKTKHRPPPRRTLSR